MDYFLYQDLAEPVRPLDALRQAARQQPSLDPVWEDPANEFVVENYFFFPDDDVPRPPDPFDASTFPRHESQVIFEQESGIIDTSVSVFPAPMGDLVPIPGVPDHNLDEVEPVVEGYFVLPDPNDLRMGGDENGWQFWNVDVFEEPPSPTYQYFFFTEEEIQPPAPPFDPADGLISTIGEVPVGDDEWPVAVYHLSFVYPNVGKVCDVSAVDVWNVALAELGLNPVQTIADQTPQAIRLNSVWNNFRKQWIEQHPWGGAKKTIQLSRRSETPIKRWSYMFDFPTDYLHALSVNGRQLQDSQDNWEIETDPNGENRVLMTDEAEVYLEYIFDPVNLCTLAPLTIYAMGVSFAAFVAPGFGVKGNRLLSLQQRAREVSQSARSNDSMEGIPRNFYNEDLVDASDAAGFDRFPIQGVPPS